MSYQKNQETIRRNLKNKKNISNDECERKRKR